ncbi:MAG: hypothetical protein IPM16_14450 [Chloroflexi bacterium]|nr:hypothetical protein [Chloroflexota bacterium]
MKRQYVIVLTLVVCAFLSVSVLQAQEPRAPSNDNSGASEYIALNGKYRADDIHLASTELGETDCGLIATNGSKSVWYRFQAPFSATISISTLGSVLYTSEFSAATSTGLSLYANDPLNQLDCTFSLGGTPAQLTDVSINQGTWYFIRVTSIVTPLPGSFYVLRTRVDSVSGFISVGGANKSFESGLAPWIAKKANNGDQVVCGTGDQYVGSCAYKFVGGADEATSIKQTFLWPTAQFVGLKDQLVLGQGHIKRTGAAINVKITLKVAYTDGTPTSKAKVSVTTAGSYSQINVQVELASRNVSTTTFQVKNKSTDGTVVVDLLDAFYLAGAVRSTGAGPLPVPAAMQ